MRGWMNGRMLLLGAYYGPSLIIQKQHYPRYLKLLTFIEIYFPLTKDDLIILSKTLIFWRWMKTVNAHLHPDSQHICFSTALLRLHLGASTTMTTID